MGLDAHFRYGSSTIIVSETMCDLLLIVIDRIRRVDILAFSSPSEQRRHEELHARSRKAIDKGMQ